MITGGKMSEFDILEEIVELEAEMANSNGVVAFGNHNSSNNNSSSSASLSNIGALHSLEEAILCSGTRASQQQQQRHESTAQLFNHVDDANPLDVHEALSSVASLTPADSASLCDTLLPNACDDCDEAAAAPTVEQLMQMDYLHSLGSIADESPAVVSSASASPAAAVITDLLAPPALSSLVSNSTADSSSSSADQSSSSSMIISAGSSSSMQHQNSSATAPKATAILSIVSLAPEDHLAVSIAEPSALVSATTATSTSSEMMEVLMQQQQQSEGIFGEDDQSAASTVDVNDFQCPISQCTFFSKVDGELLAHFRATHIKCPKVQVFDPAERVNRLLYRCLRKNCRELLPTVDDFFKHLMVHKRKDVDLADHELAKYLKVESEKAKERQEAERRRKAAKLARKTKSKLKGKKVPADLTASPTALLEQEEGLEEVSLLEQSNQAETTTAESSTPSTGRVPYRER